MECTRHNLGVAKATPLVQGGYDIHEDDGDDLKGRELFGIDGETMTDTASTIVARDDYLLGSSITMWE